MNIYQKLVEVRKTVPYLQKVNDGHQFKYTGSSQVLAAVRAKLDELGLYLTVKVNGHNVLTQTVENKDKYGNIKKTTTYFTELDLTYTWINAENPEETIEIPFYAQGVDIAGEKGVGKALTYAEKYFMLKQFNIATDKDDPDSFQKKAEKAGGKSQQQQQNPQQNGNQQQPQKKVTENQLKALHAGINEVAELAGGNTDADVVKDTLKATFQYEGSFKDLTESQAKTMMHKLNEWKQHYSQQSKESA